MYPWSATKNSVYPKHTIGDDTTSNRNKKYELSIAEKAALSSPTSQVYNINRLKSYSDLSLEHFKT